MQIINRRPNIKEDICYKINSKGFICDVSKDDVLKISAPFEELKKEGKSISNVDDLTRTSEIVRQKHIAKMKLLRRQQNGGYVFIGSLTCAGTFLIGAIIFLVIKFMLTK